LTDVMGVSLGGQNWHLSILQEEDYLWNRITQIPT
jgi:hypothetical protein